MVNRLSITPVSAPVRGCIRPPGSKSITNRALVCAALADGASTLSGALDSEDTRVMIDSLCRLGVQVDVEDDGRRLIVWGRGGEIPVRQADLFAGNSGTTIRFLTALCALGHGTYRLDGVPRMRERPIGDLLEALNQLGADCRGELREGYPPVVVQASRLRGGTAKVRGDVSSQFLSALLMAAPCAQSDVELIVEGELVSKPYVAMTLVIMQRFGCIVECQGNPVAPESTGSSSFRIVAPMPYRRCTLYEIEPDASAASYFWAAAAITGGEVTVTGLSRDALQGDAAFVECLARMGCRVDYDDDCITITGRAERGIDVDMNAISDTVQTLAAVALFARGATTIRGVAHIRHKESDRIGDLARELRNFGAVVDEFEDGLRITPPADFTTFHGAEIETYNDHRMAMSLALPGLRLGGVTILNPGCTAKTYPDYFSDLAALCGTQG